MSVSDFLRDQLDALKAAGCVKAKVTFGPQNTVTSVEVEFPAAPTPAGAFVGADGKPVNVDEGMPPLAKDPDEDEVPLRLDTSDTAIEQVNFREKKPKAA